MVRIRLSRVGARRQPSYRIVVADSRSPRDGRFIEKIGFYNPRTEPATMEINEERALYWLGQGAQPSKAVERILDKLGTQGRYERLRTGEALEQLLAEAEAETAQRGPIDPRTRRDDLPKESKKAKRKTEAAAATEAKVEAEAVAEAEPEPVSEAEPEAGDE